jgi:hypothetical protein
LLFFRPASLFSKDNQASGVLRYLQHADVRFDILNAGIGMPPHFINGRLHPGFQLGLQHPFRQKHRKSYGEYFLGAGYFAQRSLQRAFFLKPGIGYTVPIYKGITIRPVCHLSLMTVKQINDEFKLNDHGVYEQVSKYRFQMMPSFGLETAVPVAHGKHRCCAITLGYDFGLQLPFSALSSLLPMNVLHAGVRITKLKP